jgi:hypothetical protein
MPRGDANAETFAQLPFPLKGLDVNRPFSEQPPQTTPVGVNCRSYDPLLNRLRGGSRSGVSRYGGLINNGINFIQELNTVAYVDPNTIGSVNYSSGGSDQTTLLYAGTYLLGYNNPSGSFALSTPIAVDDSGRMTVGASQPGTPVGLDLQPLPAALQIPLPTNFQVVAYWQPGAFPLSQGDWQTGPQFPGFGYFANLFPGATLDNNFGFPSAGVPEIVVPGTMPDLPFWLWNSGFEEIINLGFSISHAILFYLGVPGGLGDSQTGTLSLTLNNQSLPLLQFTAPANVDSATYFHIVTDDARPFDGLQDLLAFFDLTALRGVNVPVAGNFDNFLFGAIHTIDTTLFKTGANNVLGAVLTSDFGTIGAGVLGMYRFRKFRRETRWKLGFECAMLDFQQTLGWRRFSEVPRCAGAVAGPTAASTALLTYEAV